MRISRVSSLSSEWRFEPENTGSNEYQEFHLPPVERVELADDTNIEGFISWGARLLQQPTIETGQGTVSKVSGASSGVLTICGRC
jgi:hypothetical protein